MANGHKDPRQTNDSPIAKARRAKGMTQTQLAIAVGVINAQISNWERGIRNPKYENLQKIADVLGVDVRTLRVKKSPAK